jgi:hypothetical protein
MNIFSIIFQDFIIFILLNTSNTKYYYLKYLNVNFILNINDKHLMIINIFFNSLNFLFYKLDYLNDQYYE